MFFNRVFFHNDIINWAAAFTIALGIYLALSVVKAAIQRRLSQSAAKTETDWDDFILRLVERINRLVLLALAAYAGLLVLTLPANVQGWFAHLVIAIILFQTALLGSQAINFFMGRYRRLKIQQNGSAVSTFGVIGFVLQVLLSLRIRHRRCCSAAIPAGRLGRLRPELTIA